MPAESPHPRNPRQNSAATADTLLNVRQKNMPSATVHLESYADRQETWCDSMTIRTTEASREEYPEAEITVTAIPDRPDTCHSNNIPEARRKMISGFPHPALATGRRARNNPGRMKPQAAIRQRRTRGSGNTISSLRDQNRTQARCHAPSDHERKCANRLVQLIAGRGDFRATATVMRRSSTGPAKSRAGRVPSLPIPAIHPPRQPAIPDEGR